MKNFLVLIIGLLLFAGCKEDDPTLPTTNGTEADTLITSKARFSYVIRNSPGGDTLPFKSTAIFTNGSTNAFSYFWEFGDATNSVLRAPSKVYSESRVYDVKLTSVGKAGTSTAFQRISIDGSCSFEPFANLTGCNSRKWQLSPASGSIRILNSDNTLANSSSPAPCQADDIYTFFSDGKLEYDAKSQTFEAQEMAPGICKPSFQNAKKFYLIKNVGGNPKIVLDTAGVGRIPFIGTTRQVVNNTFEILSVSAAQLVIEGALVINGTPNGQKIQMTLINRFDINSVKTFLTGGSSRTWRLDSTDGAKSIVVGTENNPTEYYGGGALATCQKDDRVTFSDAGQLTVEINGETVIPTAGFSCGASANVNAPYTFSAVVGSVVGLAQINLAAGNAAQWIGVLDRAPENVYRIISIDNDAMVLRAGNGLGTIHTFKYVREN